MLLLDPPLEPDRFVHQDDGDPAGNALAVDDHDLVDTAVNAVRGLGTGVLERKGLLLDSTEAFLEIGDDLLRPGHEDDASRT